MPSISIASRKRRSLGVSTLKPPRMRPLALMMSVGSVMPGETSVRTKWTVVPGLGRDELVGLEVDAKALRIERIHEGGAGEVAGHAAVARRHLSQVLGPDNAAGAVHVLDDDIRRAVDVAGEVLGEQATLDVGRPAGCEVDQDGETLAGVEGIIGAGRRCGHRESGAKRDDGAHPKHHDPPRVLFCTSLTACSTLGKEVTPASGHDKPSWAWQNTAKSFPKETPCWKKPKARKPKASTPMIGPTTICANSSRGPNGRARSCASRAPIGSWKWARWPRS